MSKDTPTMTEQKEHAKMLHAHIVKMTQGIKENAQDRAMLVIQLYAGMLAETLFEYEEPDVVMEQTFYRIADLLETEPEEVNIDVLEKLMPSMEDLDYYTEKGRSLSLKAAEQLEKDMADVHEIVIGLIMNDFPAFEENPEIDMKCARCLRLLMEIVIVCAIFEMAAQEFCDLLVDEFIGEGWGVDISLASLAGLVMVYGLESLEERKAFSKEDIGQVHEELLKVVCEEVRRHSDKDTGQWASLNPVNDEQDNSHYREMLEELREPVDNFFEMVGFTDKMGQAVAVAKAVGRMVAVSTSDEAGYMPGPVGQMLVWRGMQSVLSGERKNA